MAEQQQKQEAVLDVKLDSLIPKESGFSSSEFWVNGGVGATLVVLVDKALAAINATPETAWPVAVAAGAGCIALAVVGFGYALLRTRRKESVDMSESALRAMLMDGPEETVNVSTAPLGGGGAALARDIERNRDQILAALGLGKTSGVAS